MMFISADNEYPRFIGDLQLDHPSWVEGDTLPDGWRLVTPTDMPTCLDSQRVEEVMPIQDSDGNWVQTWSIVALTEEQLAIKNAPNTVRAKFLEQGFSDIEIDYILKSRR